MKVETNIGELEVRELSAFEDRENMIYVALLNNDKSMDNIIKAKKLAEYHFRRLALACNVTVDELRKLDKKSFAKVEDAYSKLNTVSGGEVKDF